MSGIYLRNLSFPKTLTPEKTIAIWGDSTTYGTGASLASDIIRSVLSRAFTPNRQVVSLAVGGETAAEITERFLARPQNLRGDTLHVINYGRADYAADASDFVTQADRIWADRDHDRVLFMVPGPGSNANEQTPGSSQIVTNNTARSQLIAAYPDNYIDQMQALWDGVTGGDSAADIAAESVGYCPPKYNDDDIHRNSAGQLIEATAIYDAIIAQGW